MSITSIIERIIHPRHRIKLTPDEERLRIQKRREELRKAGVWLGFD